MKQGTETRLLTNYWSLFRVNELSGGIRVDGHYAFLATSGLQIFDISSIEKPRIVGWLDLTQVSKKEGFSTDVFVEEDFAYICNHRALIKIYISEITDLWVDGIRIFEEGKGCTKIFVVDQYVYTTHQNGGIRITDFNKDDPEEVFRSDDPEEFFHGVVVVFDEYSENEYACFNGDEVIKVIDVTNKYDMLVMTVEDIIGESYGSFLYIDSEDDYFLYLSTGQITEENIGGKVFGIDEDSVELECTFKYSGNTSNGVFAKDIVVGESADHSRVFIAANDTLYSFDIDSTCEAGGERYSFEKWPIEGKSNGIADLFYKDQNLFVSHEECDDVSEEDCYSLEIFSFNNELIFEALINHTKCYNGKVYHVDTISTKSLLFSNYCPELSFWAVGRAGMMIFNHSNPEFNSKPRIMFHFYEQDIDFRYISVIENKIYVADMRNGFFIFDWNYNQQTETISINVLSRLNSEFPKLTHVYDIDHPSLPSEIESLNFGITDPIESYTILETVNYKNLFLLSLIIDKNYQCEICSDHISIHRVLDSEVYNKSIDLGYNKSTGIRFSNNQSLNSFNNNIIKNGNIFLIGHEDGINVYNILVSENQQDLVIHDYNLNIYPINNNKEEQIKVLMWIGNMIFILSYFPGNKTSKFLAFQNININDLDDLEFRLSEEKEHFWTKLDNIYGEGTKLLVHGNKGFVCSDSGISIFEFGVIKVSGKSCLEELIKYEIKDSFGNFLGESVVKIEVDNNNNNNNFMINEDGECVLNDNNNNGLYNDDDEDDDLEGETIALIATSALIVVCCAVLIVIPLFLIMGSIIFILCCVLMIIVICGCILFCFLVTLILGFFGCCSCCSFCFFGMGKKKRKNGLLVRDKFDILDAELNNKTASAKNIEIEKSLFEIEYKDLSVINTLGQGGSGAIIYQCTWKSTDCAFKCFRTKDLFDTQDSFDIFEKEVNIMSSVRHPNCLFMYGCCFHPPRVGIVMEYCSNGDLKNYIGKNPEFSIEERWRILCEVCKGMVYLHDRNVIHRDIKSENILINSEMTAKIIDFGLSKITARMSMTKTKSIGTSMYMSPEIVQGGYYTEKCDVFSFSIVMWEIVCSDFEPYPGGGYSIEYKVANDSNFRPDIERIPEPGKTEMSEVIKKCWDADPSKRLSFEELVIFFENLMNKSINNDNEVDGKSEDIENT